MPEKSPPKRNQIIQPGTTFADFAKGQGVTSFSQKAKQPLWKGPTVDGVTFSMLASFMGCRERFRVKVIEGLRPQEGFNHRIEYGHMWHLCEEYHAQGQAWERALEGYCQQLARQYPMDQNQINKWFNICSLQFPLYVEYWSRNADEIARQPVLQEYPFDTQYLLKSGRIVRLRGKWDSIDLVHGELWLQENKTKGDIDQLQIGRQLKFDMQTMIYLSAMLCEQTRMDDSTAHARMTYREGRGRNAYRIAGVRYNVVRRPLSGSKGSIRQKQGESEDQYYRRLAEYIVNEPDTYFMRWNIPIDVHDIIRFQHRCLDPILEQICTWYDYVTQHDGGLDPFGPHRSAEAGGIHWQHPFGLYNVLDEGGNTDLDEYLATGSEVGLTRVNSLFTELEP